MICPLCKNGELTRFDRAALTDTYTCTYCQKVTLTRKNSVGQIIEVVAPVVGTLGAGVGILHFFGVDSMDELIDALA